MTVLSVLLNDMNLLESDLSRFEVSFGVKSQDFYAAMMRGDLEKFDDLDEYRQEFIAWLALYKTWLAFAEQYRQIIDRQPIAIQIRANLEPVYA